MLLWASVLARIALSTETGFWAANERYTDKQFRSRYRLSRNAFRKLIEYVRPLLEPDQRSAGRGGCRGHVGQPLDASVKIAIALRFLAGSRAVDYLDSSIFGMGERAD